MKKNTLNPSRKPINPGKITASLLREWRSEHLDGETVEEDDGFNSDEDLGRRRNKKRKIEIVKKRTFCGRRRYSSAAADGDEWIIWRREGLR